MLKIGYGTVDGHNRLDKLNESADRRWGVRLSNAVKTVGSGYAALAFTAGVSDDSFTADLALVMAGPGSRTFTPVEMDGDVGWKARETKGRLTDILTRWNGQIIAEGGTTMGSGALFFSTMLNRPLMFVMPALPGEPDLGVLAGHPGLLGQLAGEVFDHDLDPSKITGYVSRALAAEQA